MRIGDVVVHIKGTFHITGKNTFESKLKEYKISKGCLYSRFKRKKSKWTKLNTLVSRKRSWTQHDAKIAFDSKTKHGQEMKDIMDTLIEETKNEEESTEVVNELEKTYNAISSGISHARAENFLLQVHRAVNYDKIDNLEYFAKWRLNQNKAVEKKAIKSVKRLVDLMYPPDNYDYEYDSKE
jgi:hypothetical protein